MNIKQMYIQAEIAFWDRMINLLQRSTRLRRILGGCYRLTEDSHWVHQIPRPLLWIGLGMSVGFFFGLLGGLIF